MGFYQFPIDHIVTKKYINMLVRGLTRQTIEIQVLPIAYSGYQFNSWEVGETKNKKVLTLSISMNDFQRDY